MNNGRTDAAVPVPVEPTRVLVIEDERLAQDALRMILELDGYEVRAAGSGGRAIRALKAFNPHLIIMDWRLPGLSGVELCREIARRCPLVPIVIVSSSDDAFSSAVDVTARLRKPLDVRHLREVVASSVPAHARRRKQTGAPL